MENRKPSTVSIVGCGWLGLPLAALLARSGFKVKGSTTNPEKLKVLKEYGIDPFIFLLDKPSSTDIPFLDSEIVIISIPSKDINHFKILIKRLEERRVKKVLFISSTSVYGPSEQIITEEAPLLQTPLVEIEKAFIDSSEFQTTVIRFGGLVGYSRNPGRFFKEGKKVRDPNNVVNLIHRDDCIGIMEAIINKEIWGEVFNGCADTHPTKLEFYSKAAVDIGLEPPEFEINNEMSRKRISNEKVKNLLNYKFKHPDLMKIKFE